MRNNYLNTGQRECEANEEQMANTDGTAPHSSLVHVASSVDDSPMLTAHCIYIHNNNAADERLIT